MVYTVLGATRETAVGTVYRSDILKIRQLCALIVHFMTLPCSWFLPANPAEDAADISM